MVDGLMTRVGAEPAEERLLARELAAAVAAGSPTTASYAVRFGRGEFGTFAAEPGDDPLTAEVRERIAPLLTTSPEQEPVQILASKPLQLTSAYVTKGLLLTFTAQPDHEPEVEALLMDSHPGVEAEEGTAAWYALRMANGDFGVFDVFPNRRSRLRHMTGSLPRELLKRTGTRLTGLPRTHLLDVVAATPAP